MNNVNLAAGRQIKEIRKARKISQQSVAEHTGLTRTSISNIENGRQALSLELFCKIADHLNISPALLLNMIIELDNAPFVTSNEVTNDRVREMIQNTLS